MRRRRRQTSDCPRCDGTGKLTTQHRRGNGDEYATIEPCECSHDGGEETYREQLREMS